MRLDGSGSLFPLAHILAPGAYARMPLVDRISELKIPISFVCRCFSLCPLLSPQLSPCADGEHDWMDPSGGVSSIDNLKAAGNESARMFIVPRAGHHGELSIQHVLLFPCLTCYPATSVSR